MTKLKKTHLLSSKPDSIPTQCLFKEISSSCWRKVLNFFPTIDIRKEAKANLTKDISMNLDISWDNCSKIGQLITEGLNTLEG